MVGYSILLYDHPSVVLLDVLALEGYKRRGVEQQFIAHAEARAGDREYPYLRAGLAPEDPYITPVFAGAGFHPLQYRRWEFVGEMRGRDTPEGLTIHPVIGQASLDHRKRFLEAELAAADPAGRDLILDTFVPKRPSMGKSFVASLEGAAIAYVSVKREDQTHTLSLSLMPEYWGEDLEGSLLAAMVSTVARTGQAKVRVRVDSTPHAEAVSTQLAEMGLERQLVDPDIWFKEL
jgi:hypothetical protein